MIDFFYNFIVFAVGAAVGSFLNVVVFRLENEQRIIKDRSKCPHCRHVLAWYDLIPIFSFLFLLGKCRYCSRNISAQYPLVETSTGILFVLVVNHGLDSTTSIMQRPEIAISVLYTLFIASSLVVLFVYDLRHYIIPDEIVYPAICVSFVYKLFESLSFDYLNLGAGISEFVSYFLIPAIAAGAFFYIIVITTKGRGMGGGDVKFAFLIGLVLGWPATALALFFSFVFGSTAGIILVLINKKNMKSTIPFGPFLVLGTFVALFFGREIMGWYWKALF